MTQIDCKLLDRRRSPTGEPPRGCLMLKRDTQRAISRHHRRRDPRALSYVRVWEELSENDECFKVGREGESPERSQTWLPVSSSYSK